MTLTSKYIGLDKFWNDTIIGVQVLHLKKNPQIININKEMQHRFHIIVVLCLQQLLPKHTRNQEKLPQSHGP